mgnify:CR=1 FL=1
MKRAAKLKSERYTLGNRSFGCLKRKERHNEPAAKHD